jgi:hypothetical protein
MYPCAIIDQRREGGIRIYFRACYWRPESCFIKGVLSSSRLFSMRLGPAFRSILRCEQQMFLKRLTGNQIQGTRILMEIKLSVHYIKDL